MNQVENKDDIRRIELAVREPSLEWGGCSSAWGESCGGAAETGGAVVGDPIRTEIGSDVFREVDVPAGSITATGIFYIMDMK